MSLPDIKQVEADKRIEPQAKAQFAPRVNQMAPTVPTLSHLVSLSADRLTDDVKIDMDSLNQLENNLSTTSSLSQVYIESPISSPDNSLELGSDLITRSDDLVRKLRLLLELRKNELQGIDSSLFSGLQYKVPQTFTEPTETFNPVSVQKPQANQNQNKTPKKKFYNQKDGLFFLTLNGAKKGQQDMLRNQIREIC